jgi:predicted AlkP superfamily phosphohydrolase/phosphomutase
MLQNFNGSQVVGWGSVHADVLEAGYDPPEVERWLMREVPGRRTGFLWSVPYEADELLEYLDDALLGIEQHAKGIALLMERTQWELFVCGLPESHDAAHFLWRYHDPSHDEHDPDGPVELKRGMRTIMERVDRAVADMIARIPSDATILLVSATGMEPIPRGVCASETFLERGGWLKRVHAWSPGPGSGRGLLRLGRSVFRSAVPLGVRRAIARSAPRTRYRLVQATALSDIDWRATKAFLLRSHQTTNVRVNLLGREPAGIVRPGEEYDHLLAEITDAAFELIDADTGELAVANVVRTDRITGSPVGDVLPDLIIVWKPRSPKRLSSTRLGMIDVVWNDRRSGEHTAAGFVVAAGPSITPSGRAELSDEVRPYVDIAPTVLRLLGVDVPDRMTGCAIEELVGT